MKLTISALDKQVLRPCTKQSGCNCKDKNKCPLDKKCQTTGLIYQADVTIDVDDEYKYYLGLTEICLRNDLFNYKGPFRNESKYQHRTIQICYCRLLKKGGEIPQIK